MAYIKIATETELPAPGEAKEFEIAGKTICGANVNGTVTAIENVCLHMGGPLGQGYVDGEKIVCPWHGWEYKLTTGECAPDPKIRLKRHEIVQREGEVYVVV